MTPVERPKLSDQEVDTLRDLEKPHGQRTSASSTASLITERLLESMRARGWVRWVQVNALHQSLAEDHYALLPAGRAQLAAWREWVRYIGTPHPAKP